MAKSNMFAFLDGAANRRTGPIREVKLGEQLYQYLNDLVISGKIAAGAKLPTEKQLCETFGISRPVVREALARLRMEGLVESRRGSGSYVTGTRVPPPVVARGPVAGSTLDGRENRVVNLVRYFELRLAIECDAAYYAAMRRTPVHLAAMTAALEEMDAAVRTRSLNHDAHFKFHLAVAEAADNPLFVNALHSLRPYMDVSMNLLRDLWLLDPETPINTGQHQHAEIYEAIAESKPEEARLAMRLHLVESRRELFGDAGEAGPLFSGDRLSHPTAR